MRLESVDDALSKQAGVARDRESRTCAAGAAVRSEGDRRRGQAPGDGLRRQGLRRNRGRGEAGAADGVATLADPPRGSVTGGTTPPNGENFELMYFEHAGVNPFVATDEDALSTFALDVDNASFTLARNYLDRGVLPPPDAIRVEEFVNAFDAGWPAHSDRDLPHARLDGGSVALRRRATTCCASAWSAAASTSSSASRPTWSS